MSEWSHLEHFVLTWLQSSLPKSSSFAAGRARCGARPKVARVVAATGLQRNAWAASVTRGEWVVGMGHDYARGGQGGKRGAAVVQAGVD